MKEVKTAATSPEVRAALHEVLANFEAFKATNDQRLDAIEHKRGDGLLEDKLDRIETALQSAESRLQRLMSQKSRPMLAHEGRQAQPDEAKAAWEGYLKSGRLGIELKAGISSGSGSGVLAPTETETFIERRLALVSPFRSLATVRAIGSATFRKPISTASVTSGWVAETAARPETNPATLDLVTFASGELYASPSATQDILDDAYINLDEWLASEIEDSFAAQETAAFVNGDGSNKPKGFLNYTIAAEGTATWGQIGYVASGAAADFTTTNPTDALISLIYAPKSQYRPNASFVMNRRTAAKISVLALALLARVVVRFSFRRAAQITVPANAVVRQTIITGFRLLELPCFGVDEQNIRPILVPSADIWAGVDVYAGAGAESLRRRGRVEQAAAIGRTLNALPVQRGHYLLRGASLDIYLEGVAPVSRTEADLLGGENVICVRALNGEWEMIQYLNVIPLAVDRYRLSGLVRGQWGTEQARLAGMAAGAEVILLPAGFVRADMATDEIGLTRLWRTGRIGFGGVADQALDVTATWTGLALRPRAPVFGRVMGVGDLTISWLRVPRYGGDSWEAEPPLCEDYERYRVQVFDGADVVREVEVVEPVWVYSASDRAVDFAGGFGAGTQVEISQKSQVYGFGPVLSLMLG